MSRRLENVTGRARKHLDNAARLTHGFVRTPPGLADELASGHRDIGWLPPGARVLEPSAGDGAIVRAILDNDRDAHVVAVEPDGTRADALDALAAEFPGRVVTFRGTFEDYTASCRAPEMHDPRHVAMGGPFDAVVMNPPFGDASRDLIWMDHVRGAWELLRPGALLVSIVPPGYEFRGDRRHREFRDWAQANGATFEKLPGTPFAESGTNTRAGVLTVPRPMPDHAGGLPPWLYVPASGALVTVDRPAVTAAAAIATPVQTYQDRRNGDVWRTLRYVGTCHGCGRVLWEDDGRGGAAMFDACTLDPAEYGQVGPTVVLCMDHYHNAESSNAALKAAALYRTPAGFVSGWAGLG